MEYFDWITYRRSIRLLLGSVVLFIVYQHEVFRSGRIETALLVALVLVLYLMLIWLPSTWWNTAMYAAITLLIVAITLAIRIRFGQSEPALLWPIVFILPTLPKRYEVLSITLAIPPIVTILILSYNHTFPYSILLALCGLFIGIRARRVRREAYQISQQHLEELNEAHTALQKAHADLQAATVHSMQHAALAERSRLARDIHDGIGHQLTGLIIQLRALKVLQQSDPVAAAETVSHLTDIAEHAMREVRLAVRDWADDERELGLVALRGLVSQVKTRSDIGIEWIQSGELSEWPLDTSVALYRVLQESLTNVLRHAHATVVLVRIEEFGNQVRMTVEDDGGYTEDMPLPNGFGMSGMADRSHQCGGSFTVSPVRPHGLRVEVTLPLVTAAHETEEVEG